MIGLSQLITKEAKLTLAKERKWEELKQARSEAQASPFTYDGNSYDTKGESLTFISGATMAAFMSKVMNSPYEQKITLADNTSVALGADQMIAVGLACAAHVDACHSQGRLLRAVVETSTTLEQLEAVRWGNTLPGDSF